MTSARELVEATLYRYAAVIDDGDLSDWPGFFAEDADYRVTSRENFARGLPACVMYCKNRAMMRDRVVAIKRANVVAPQYYRHHYSNVLVERAGEELSVRANYLVCRTHEDGDTIVFSTGRVIARAVLPAEVMTWSLPPSQRPSARGDLVGARAEGAFEASPWTIRSVELPAPSGEGPGEPGREAEVSGGAGPHGEGAGALAGSGPGRALEGTPTSVTPTTLRPPSFEAGARSAGAASVRGGSVSLLPPSSRRQPGGLVFLSMTVVYDTCRIPGLLVFPL